MKLRIPREGRMEDFPLFKILAEIHTAKLSGVLTVSGDKDTVDINVEAGYCVSAASHYPRDEVKLGQLLLVRKLITEEQLQSLLDRQTQELLLLGKLAVDAGHITETELSRVLEDQILLLIFPCLTWKKGVFFFQQFESVPYVKRGFRPIDLKILFRNGSKIAKSWQWVEDRLPSDNLVPTRIEGVQVVSEGVQVDHESGDNKAISLTRNQDKTYQLIDGNRSIREICDAVHLFEWHTRTSIIDLQDAGIINIPKKPSKKKQKKTDKEKKPFKLKIPKIDFKQYVPVLLKSVAGIISIVLLIAGGLYLSNQDKSETQPVKAISEKLKFSPKAYAVTLNNAEDIQLALTVFYLFNKAYPDSLEDLVDRHLLNEKVIIDGWNNSFEYSSQNNKFSLLSIGRDLKHKTSDDLIVTGQANDHIFGCVFPLYPDEIDSEEETAEREE